MRYRYLPTFSLLIRASDYKLASWLRVMRLRNVTNFNE